MLVSIQERNHFWENDISILFYYKNVTTFSLPFCSRRFSLERKYACFSFFAMSIDDKNEVCCQKNIFSLFIYIMQPRIFKQLFLSNYKKLLHHYLKKTPFGGNFPKDTVTSTTTMYADLSKW